MLLTLHFVFIHFQKTGGVFIKNVCRTHAAEWIVSDSDAHLPASAIPAEFAHLPVLGFVRNPWDWYVSWFHYVKAHRERFQDGEHGPWGAVFNYGQASFGEVIRAACAGVPANGESPAWMDRMRADGVDLYTRMFDQVFGDDGVEIGRFEQLRADFLSFLRRHHVPVPNELEQAVLTRPPDNQTHHAPYRSYYDHKLRELVARSSRIGRNYGYEF